MKDRSDERKKGIQKRQQNQVTEDAIKRIKQNRRKNNTLRVIRQRLRENKYRALSSEKRETALENLKKKKTQDSRNKTFSKSWKIKLWKFSEKQNKNCKTEKKEN